MKDEKQIREMASSLLDIKDARDHLMELWTSPWAECLMNVLGERKSNGHSIEIMNDYYTLLTEGRRISERDMGLDLWTNHCIGNLNND